MKYLLVVLTVTSFLVSCNPKTSEIIEVAETVEEAETSTTGGMPKSDIGEGKVVFLTNCIDCHYGRSANRVPELVDSYTKEQWANILPKMVIQAELNDEKSRQIAAYIAWELEN